MSGNTFSLPFLNTGGTLVLLAGLITAAVLAVSASGAAQEWLATVSCGSRSSPSPACWRWPT